MTSRYPRPVQSPSSSVWQALPAGADVPDSTQDAPGFAQFMEQTYGPPPAPCAQLDLMTGDLIWSPDHIDVDVVVAVPPVGPTPTTQPNAPAQSVTVTFEYTGGPQTWTAPAGVTQATVAMIGAQGGTAGDVQGGNGAWALADLAVTPGASYQINVGGRGGDGAGDGGGGGSNGGGPGGASGSATLPLPEGAGGLRRARRRLLERRTPAGGRWRRGRGRALQLPALHAHRQLRRRRRPGRNQTASTAAPTASRASPAAAAAAPGGMVQALGACPTGTEARRAPGAPGEPAAARATAPPNRAGAGAAAPSAGEAAAPAPRTATAAGAAAAAAGAASVRPGPSSRPACRPAPSS